MFTTLVWGNTNAQSTLRISLKDGSQKEVSISTLKKLHFNNQSFVFNYTDGGSDSFLVEEIRTLTFAASPTKLEDAERYKTPQNGISLSNNGNTLKLHLAEEPRTAITLFNADGRVIRQLPPSEAGAISIADLAQGIYLLHINNHTFKFTKR